MAPTPVPVGSKTLLVYDLGSYGKGLEVQNLSEVLGYSRPSAIKSLVRRHWGKVFRPGVEVAVYELPQDQPQLEAVLGHPPKKNTTFLLKAGIETLLERTSFDSRLIRAKLDLITNSFQEPPEADEINPYVEDSSGSLADRQFRHGALQTLLGQLERLTDPKLRRLAIRAAEIALGETLEMLEPVEEITASPSEDPFPIPDTGPAKPKFLSSPVLSQARQQSSGPLFTAPGWHSFTQIGAKAGGFSARDAGEAANIVGARMGHSPHGLRTETLLFTKHEGVSRSRSGRKKVLFSTTFANQVVAELRTNPKFVSAPIKQLVEFSNGSSLKLTEPVFQD